jgi:hypothetical protein
MVDAGLADLAAGLETPESLLVSLAAPRLRREGVPLPSLLLPQPEERLYRLLEATSGDLAHARYRAWLAQAASFADACRTARRDREHRAQPADARSRPEVLTHLGDSLRKNEKLGRLLAE